VRSSGGYVSKALQAAGMAPVNMPAADLYLSMQRGVIDATVLAYASATRYKLSEIVHNVCELSLGATPLVVVMNERVWQQLPKDIQEVFDSLQEEATFRGGNSYDSTDDIGRKVYADAGVNTYKLPSAEMTKLVEKGKVVWNDWVAEMEQKGLPGKKAYAEFLSILEKLGEKPPYSN
jgi:TRAP-type C4-dicarboxylate transport system substrate-binding protein